VISALVLLRLALQSVLPPAVGSTVQPSVIAQAGLTIPAIVLLFVTAYMLMGLTFILLKDRLPGSKGSKGLRFGLAFVLMWGAFLLEPVGVSVVDYSGTIGTAFVDTVPIALLGIALGLFVSSDVSPGRGSNGTRVLFIAAVPLAFVTTRLVEYAVLGVYSVFSTMPVISTAWATGTGVCIAAMYLLIRDALPTRSPIKRAFLFSVAIFATNMLVFNMFMPAIMEFTIWDIGALSYADLVVRISMDSAAVFVGVTVFEYLSLMKISREVNVGRSTEG
jgi:hypothetical protein